MWFAGQVEKRRRNLFNFLLFLRITPFLPNFFINLASPLLGVPLHYFVLATMFGIMPATFMHVSAGKRSFPTKKVCASLLLCRKADPRDDRAWFSVQCWEICFVISSGMSRAFANLGTSAGLSTKTLFFCFLFKICSLLEAHRLPFEQRTECCRRSKIHQEKEINFFVSSLMLFF